MDFLLQLVEQAKREHDEYVRLDDEMSAETVDTIRFLKLEKRTNRQYEKFKDCLNEVEKCLKSIIKFYDYL